MARKGRSFELAYKWLYELDGDKYKAISPAYVYDKTTNGKREVDNLIEYKDNNGCLRKISVECRDRKNKEDLMWIEQLKTKKEDLGLDYVIAITTSKFTKGAIDKARYHGVIIEEAEYLDKKLLDNISDEFIIDLLFMKFEVKELKFLIKGKIITFKELFSKIGMIEQSELIIFLNKGYYYSIEPNELMDQLKIDRNYFFEYDDSNFLTYKNDIFFNNNIPPIIEKLQISRMSIAVKLIPYKVSLPLNKSLSVFDVDPKKNKKYSAYYGSEEEFIIIGYLNDNEVIQKVKLKNRKYYRFIGANMKLNTVFPNGLDNSRINMDEFIKNGLGEFYFSNVA